MAHSVRPMGRAILKIAAAVSLMGLAAPPPPLRADMVATIDAMPQSAGLSVMTYNIEGLPWPLRFGRPAAFDTMTDALRRMRSEGRQPHVVLLQEAFSDAAREIGRDAGYRYVTNGPAAADAGTAMPGGQDAFVADARWLKGEREGKWLGSGLQILSDYPILSVTRAAFPAEACAGFDCLANKGMVAVTVAVPGMASPVAIVDLHLNARKASGVDPARAFHAYRLQIDALADFVARTVPANMPLILSGDFNIGKEKERRDYVAARLARFSSGGGVMEDALDSCAVDRAACPAGLPSEAQRSRRKGKDRQFFRSGTATLLQAKAVAVPFGHDADGKMLSDHIGYIAYY